MQLERLSEKMDSCLHEVLSLKFQRQASRNCGWRLMGLMGFRGMFFFGSSNEVLLIFF